MFLRRTFCVFIAILSAAASLAEIPKETRLNVIGGYTLGLLGSMDHRYGYGVSVQSLRPSRALKFKRSEAKINLEAYAFRSNSTWQYGPRGWWSLQVGVLASARYEFARKVASAMFVEFGWGLNYASRTSHDLDSFVNSTPAIGIGTVFGPDKRYQFETRLIHMSNGGTHGHNKGVNYLWFMAGFRI